ncbi:amino acid permease [Luteolibacter sp. SL250]|uniref:APC family permease n=1 Tax=Luteolibacter sp. SL250 TaxID=2995170 RepID=UPI002270D424|nr:amino acid permease [Luteolibacter sp. SL250]WAC17824.1 amino acid permease [Luteolibacter sp. SL250]
MNEPAQRRIRTVPAAALVVASMVGTGVFTSLGYQVGPIPSGPALMLVWALGGLLALCGALCYAELGGALPRSGGEYHFISTLYHPSMGWAAGLISAVIGFAAPTALAAIPLGNYAHSAVDWLPAKAVSITALVAVTAGHLITLKSSAWLQTVSTILKLSLIVGFVIASFVLPGKGDVRWEPKLTEDLAIILQPAYAIALLFVFYAYSGWNAAIYILDEIDDVRRTLTRALLLGTVLVTILYLLLNMAFLRAAPLSSLQGVNEVGFVAAGSLFGEGAARWFSGLLSLGLVATVSALIWAGPRVLNVMGKDFPAIGLLGRRNQQGIPVAATLFQFLLALVFVCVGDFERLLTYTQFGLTLCSFLTVAGVFILRATRKPVPGAFRCPWFPLPPIVFLAMTGFVMVRSFIAAPVPTLAGLGTILLAWLLYFPLKRTKLPSSQ